MSTYIMFASIAMLYLGSTSSFSNHISCLHFIIHQMHDEVMNDKLLLMPLLILFLSFLTFKTFNPKYLIVVSRFSYLFCSLILLPSLLHSFIKCFSIIFHAFLIFLGAPLNATCLCLFQLLLLFDAFMFRSSNILVMLTRISPAFKHIVM